MRRYNKLHDVLEVLRKELPAEKPVRLCRVKVSQYDGCCLNKKKFFLIRIDKSLSELHAIDILLHEYAHTISFDISDSHGIKWGKAYSRVYKCFLKHFA